MGVASRAMEMSSSVISHSTWQVRGGVHVYIYVCGGSRCIIVHVCGGSRCIYMYLVVVYICNNL